MNQALIAAMAGTGLARGRHTVKRAQLTDILRGWVIGPGAGFIPAYIVERIRLTRRLRETHRVHKHAASAIIRARKPATAEGRH